MKSLNDYDRFDFFKWCMEQPPEKTICHHDWNACAFGDFAEAMLPKQWKGEIPDPQDLMDIERFGNEEKYDHGFNCPVIDKLCGKPQDIRLYSHLQKEILKHYPQMRKQP